MTILEEIEIANCAAGIKTFSFASLKEWNSFIDSFEFLDYPAHLIVPFNVPFSLSKGRRTATIPLQGWIMTRIEQDTTVYRTKEVESEYLEPMRKLAWKFLKELSNSDIINPETDEITGSVNPEYAFITAGLFGVSYTINLPITQNIC